MRKTLLTTLLLGALAFGFGKSKAQEAKADSLENKPERYYLECGQTWNIRSNDKNYFFGAGVQGQKCSCGFSVYFPLDGEKSYCEDARFWDTTTQKTITGAGDVRCVDVIKFGVEGAQGNKYGKIGAGMYFVIYGTEVTRSDTRVVCPGPGDGGMCFGLTGEFNLTQYLTVVGKVQTTLGGLESTALGLRIPIKDKK